MTTEVLNAPAISPSLNVPAPASAASPEGAKAFGAAIERASERPRRDDQRSQGATATQKQGRRRDSGDAAKGTEAAAGDTAATAADATAADQGTAATESTETESTDVDVVAMTAAAILAAAVAAQVPTDATAIGTDGTQPVVTDVDPTVATAVVVAAPEVAVEPVDPSIVAAQPAEATEPVIAGDATTAHLATQSAAAATTTAATPVNDTGVGETNEPVDEAAPDSAMTPDAEPIMSNMHATTTAQRWAPADDADASNADADSADAQESDALAAATTADAPDVAPHLNRGPQPLRAESFEAPAPVQVPRAELEARLAEEGPNGVKILGAARLLRGGPGAPSALTLNLDPASLGKIRVELSVHEGKVAVNLMAEKAQAVQAIGNQMNQLRDALEAEGLHLSNLGVDLSNQGHQSNSDRANRDGRSNVTNTIGGSGHSGTTSADSASKAERPRVVDVDALVDVDL